MKRILHQSLIATLVTIVLLLAGSSASAQTKYGLTIAGVEVTSTNYNILSNYPDIRGQVSYDPVTRTLTLEDATINGGIESSSRLTCIVKGNVSITASGPQDAMTFSYSATIQGDGQLNLTSQAGSGILLLLDNTSLIIKDCTVNVEGQWGIMGSEYASTTNLTVNHAKITVKGPGSGSICDLGSLTLKKCEVSEPAGAVWNADKHAVCDAEGNVITDEVVITPIEEYYIWIGKEQVTSNNCKDLSNIPGVTGKVSYDPNTQTLTLEDATIQGYVILLTNLTCVIKGKVSITSPDGAAMYFGSKATIKGDGELTLKSPQNNGIYTEAPLIIDGCTLLVEGKRGISGYDGTHRESLTIRNASVTAKGAEGSICNLVSFKLQGGEITKPAGADWNDEKHAVCDAEGNVIKDEVVITPVEEYGLSIAGVKVTSINYKDLSVIEGVDGKVSYDPETKTLILEDASIAGGEICGISSYTDLTCIVKGDVSITSSRWNAMRFDNKATIKGDGRLTLKSQKHCAIILATPASLTIDGCTVQAEGRWGIADQNNGASSVPLTVKNASITVKGTDGAICDLASLTLEGCEITKPAGAVWNDKEHSLCDAAGNVITDEVVITPTAKKYGLKIAGVEVTSDNCSDLSVIDGVTGKVSYDPTTKTLTLEDASIEGIWSKDELTCVVKGEVSITSKNDWSAMGFEKNAIIKGNGQLTIKSSEGNGIYTEATLLIEGCTVYAEGVFGIAGIDGKSGESLTIRNASVTAKGSTEGSICALANYKLEGCEITKPAGAVWNAIKHAVCDASGNVITSEVVISPKGGTAIDFVTPELQPAEGAIYDMNGVLRSEPLDELPTGVYIIGGQKVMHVQR